ncbi:MAG: metallophosphoesterase [candidate division WOR-3 bacterium]
MKNRKRKILFLFFLSYFSPLSAFKFCVLGDRTPLSSPETFETVLNEIRVLKPDFIIHLGNLIKKGIKDTTLLKKEWENVQRIFSQLGIPYHLCPGSEDIWDEKSEEIFLRYFSKTYYSFNYENCHFVILDFSRFPKYSDVPKEMIDWLREDLSLFRRARYTFVFAHRSYWRLLKERWGLHKVLSQLGVDYFLSAHDCFYTYYKMDSIRYLQVGPTGAKLKEETEEKRGGFPNYLLVEVDKKRVNISVIKPGSIFAPEVFSLKEIEEESLTKERIIISPFSKRSPEVNVSLENPYSYEIKGEIRWEGYSWDISPPKAKFYLSPKSKGFFPFSFSLKGEIFPLPELIFSYEREGKEEVIKKLLPLKREISADRITPKIDGELKEWRGGIDQFGDERGKKAKLNSTLFLGYDSSNLYFALLNYEKRIKARMRERDGFIKEDDFVSIFLSPKPETIYEVSFNPLGFISDSRYIKEKGKYRKREWNGKYEVKTLIGEKYWQVEISFPLLNFNTEEEVREIGFNFYRYSPDDSLFLFFQPPISGKYEPGEGNLGVLLLK